uniref:Uncharacterized protein n=1 Tax=Oryza officinalis TaxID=4535 RepID=A0A1V1H3K9_9ORYZ|nr:hypothetical protein [Oryza officinalis]
MVTITREAATPRVLAAAALLRVGAPAMTNTVRAMTTPLVLAATARVGKATLILTFGRATATPTVLRATPVVLAAAALATTAVLLLGDDTYPPRLLVLAANDSV